MLWLNGQRLLLLQVALAHCCHRFPPGGSVNCILTQLENRLAPPYTHKHSQQRFNDISHFNLCAKFFGAFTNLFLSLFHFSSLFVFLFLSSPVSTPSRRSYQPLPVNCVQGIVNFARLAVNFIRALTSFCVLFSSFWESA